MLESGTKILPSSIAFERYAAIFGINGQAARQALVFRRSILNSVIVAGVSAFLSIVFGSVAACAFPGRYLKGRRCYFVCGNVFPAPAAGFPAGSILWEPVGDGGAYHYPDYHRYQLHLFGSIKSVSGKVESSANDIKEYDDHLDILNAFFEAGMGGRTAMMDAILTGRSISLKRSKNYTKHLLQGIK